MISTRELAAIAGVSQSTVSRSLHNHPGISKATKERIAALAKENGYRISGGGGSRKARGKKKAIAVFMTGMNYMNLYLESLFIKVFNEIEKTKYLALLINDKDDIVAGSRVKELMSTGILAGLIITNLHYNSHVHEYLTSKRMPHIYLHYFGKDSLEALDIVDTDNYAGGSIAAQHLFALGHRKIKVLTSSSPLKMLDSHTFDDRTAGFAAAARFAGVKLPESNIVFIKNHDYRSAYDYVSANIDHLREFDAVFAQTDTMAIGCITAFQDNGVAVPNDISVMGYDGIDEGVFCRPSVTTVRQPMGELAEETVNRLLGLIENPAQTGRRIFIQPKLLVRQSTRDKRLTGQPEMEKGTVMHGNY